MPIKLGNNLFIQLDRLNIRQALLAQMGTGGVGPPATATHIKGSGFTDRRVEQYPFLR